jgi:hypothetical protein
MPAYGRKCSERQDLLEVHNREVTRGKVESALTSTALIRSSAEHSLGK